MKPSPLALALAALAATGAEARYMPLPGSPDRANPVPADCPLTIGFGSYAMGIDGAAYAAIERLLRADRGVRAVTRHPWGREGETTLCVRTRTRADAQRLFAQIRARLPANSRGPISMQLLGGRRYVTPPPHRRKA
jgi:hypothetical protein